MARAMARAAPELVSLRVWVMAPAALAPLVAVWARAPALRAWHHILR